jgi:pilus assembly protein TadC
LKGKKTKRSAQEQRASFRLYLAKAGYAFGWSEIFRFTLFAAGALTAVAYLFVFSAMIQHGYAWSYITLISGLFLLLGYPAAVLFSLLVFYVYTDLRISSRKQNIEKVLPEFLHLASANIRAGMSIDQALWSAIRPRFGVLAKEMEMVAKQNVLGQQLSKALLEFAEKYDSKVLGRTISLLVEGMESGSEIGELLEDIALNIQDIETRKESMAANVTTYVIFITFSVLFAAPLLFAVSIQLLRVVHSLGAGPLSNTAGAVAGISLTLSASAVKEGHFFAFCIISLIITSIMSSIIIAAIKTGRAEDAVRNIPVYVIVSVSVFFVAQWVLGMLFSGVI